MMIKNEIRVKLPWLRRRIEEGLKLFGMTLDHMQFITGFQPLERPIRNSFDVFGMVCLLFAAISLVLF